MPQPLIPYAPGAPQETELSHLQDPSSLVDWGTPHNGPLDGWAASTAALAPRVPGAGADLLSPDLRASTGPPSIVPTAPIQPLGTPVAPGATTGPLSGPMGPFSFLSDQPAPTAATSSPGGIEVSMVHPLDSLGALSKGSASGGIDPLGGLGGVPLIGGALHSITDAAGQAAAGLAARDVTLPNLASRAADYLVGGGQMLVGIVAGALGHPGTPDVNANGGPLKAWQQDPSYWTALSQATDANMQAWTTKIAAQYASGDAGKALADSMYQGMKTDQQKQLGLTSGDGTVDYQAKKPLAALSALANAQGVPISQVIAMYIGNAPNLTGTTGSVAQVFGVPTSGNAVGGMDFMGGATAIKDNPEVLRFLQTLPGAQPLSLDDQIGAIHAKYQGGTLPWIIGDAAQALNPLDAKTNDLWNSLTPQDRQGLLQLAGQQNSGPTAVLMIAGLKSGTGLVGSLAPKLAETSIGSSIITAAQFVRKGVIAATAAGTSIMLAGWAAEVAMPSTPIAGMAHSLDYSRPISDSQVGAFVNLVGMFSSAHEVLSPEIAGVRTIKSALGLGGISDHPILLDSRGGAEGLPTFVRDQVVPKALPNLLEDSQRNVIYGETQNLVRNKITGLANNALLHPEDAAATFGDRFLALTPDEQLAHLQAYVTDAGAGIEGVVAGIVNATKRAEQGRAILSPLASDATRLEYNAAAGISKLIEQEAGRQATARQQNDWALRLAGAPTTAEAIAGYMRKTVTDNPDIFGPYQEGAATRRLGTSVKKWMAAAETIHDMEFAALNGELQAHVADSIKANPDSRASGLYLVPQTHVFLHMANDLIDAKATGTRGWSSAAQRLATSTKEGQEWLATHPQGTPAQFVAHLEALRPVLIADRPLATDPTTEDLGLNRFHATLVANGRYALAYKPEFADPVDPAANQYVSYVQVGERGGPEPAQYVAAPWMEYGPAAAGRIKLANQNFLSRQVSNSLTSFGAWRQQEFQRASLFGHLSPYEGVSGAAMDAFHRDLLRRASSHRVLDMVSVPVQAQAILDGKAIQQMGEDRFGAGPKLNRITGQREVIDYASVVRNAYRQSVKLNATAGLTSGLKDAIAARAPRLAQLIVGVADVLNPIIRFESSPLFQAQIRLESLMGNVAHGATHDPEGNAGIEQTFGLTRRYGSAADMAGTDQMLGTMVTQGRARGDSLALGKPLPPDAPFDVPGGDHAPQEPLAASPIYRQPGSYSASPESPFGQAPEGTGAGTTSDPYAAYEAVTVPRRSVPNTDPPVPVTVMGDGNLETTPGTPEHLVAVGKAWQPGVAALSKKAWSALWNPGNMKEQAAADLSIRNFRDFVGPISRAAKMDGPRAVFKALGVSDAQLADFIGRDRQLVQQFYNSDPETPAGRAAEQALFDHAGGEENRGKLDAMYASPEWAAYSGLLRLVGEYAQKEAFGVHFFNSNQSFLARTLNHPVLGFYPGAWAYKVAAQWFSFMYNNHTIPGMHLGMAPAVVYQLVQQAQASTFAMQNQQSLTAYLTGKTAIGNVLFWSNLVSPGTPDSIPFTLAKPIRLILKGDFLPVDWAQQYFFGVNGQGGAGGIRDLNAASELASSIAKIIHDGGITDASQQAAEKRLDALVSSSVNAGVHYSPAGMKSVVDYPIGGKISKP